VRWTDFKNWLRTISSKYFDCARRMIDIADCRDIASLQTVVFLNMFLQCTARMSTCYSYVGVTITLALRMGLHRSLQTSVNPTEAEARSRIFWAIRNMEARVTSLLGLPRLLQDDDINQGMPADDTNEILDGEEPDPQSYSDVYTTAYAQLTQIMTKIVKRVYPVNHDVPGSASSKYWVSYVEVRQMERKLDDWRMALPYGLMANTAAKSPSRYSVLPRALSGRITPGLGQITFSVSIMPMYASCFIDHFFTTSPRL
jgi:hypothetical protein